MNEEHAAISQQILAELLKSTEAPTTAHTVSETQADDPQSVLPGEDILDFGDSLKMDNFQVVRREFFAHLLEPTVSFYDSKLSINTACISKFPEALYVQVLVDEDKKLFGLRPCTEDARDSYRWCNVSKGKRKPRDIKGKIFFAKIVHLMNWNPNNKYKVLGRLVRANGIYMLLFDLSSFETYERIFADGQKPKTSKTAVFQAEWKDSFGLPFHEHEQMMKISVFNGFAVYSVADPKPQKRSATATPMDGQLALAAVGSDGGVGNV